MPADHGIRRIVDQSQKPYRLCRCDSPVGPAAHGNPGTSAHPSVELPIRRSRIRQTTGSFRSTTGQCRHSSPIARNQLARAVRFVLLADSFRLSSPRPHGCAPACQHDLQGKPGDSPVSTARIHPWETTSAQDSGRAISTQNVPGASAVRPPTHGRHARTRPGPDSK